MSLPMARLDRANGQSRAGQVNVNPHNTGFSGFLLASGYTKVYEGISSVSLISRTESIQAPCDLLVLMRIQVAVNLQSGLHILVSKPFADEQNIRSKLNQQASVSPAEFRIKIGLGVSSNKPSAPRPTSESEGAYRLHQTQLRPCSPTCWNRRATSAWRARFSGNSKAGSFSTSCAAASCASWNRGISPIRSAILRSGRPC